MPEYSPSKANLPVPPERAWQLAVDITSRVGTDEARGISVLIYLNLVVGHHLTLKQRLANRVKFLRRLRFPRRLQPAQDACKGRPLFAFLYDTPANTNNLMPVYRASERRGWNANVLTGETANPERMGLMERGGRIGVSELISFLSPKEWFSTLASCRKQFMAVHEAFKRSAPDCAGLVWEVRDSILSELTFGMLAARGLRWLYEAWEPSLVVTTSNLWPFDQMMHVEASRMGIPTFVIQHGITNRYWWPFVATKMLLWGRSFEEEVRKLGAPAEMLAICGMPGADHLFTRYQKNAGNDTRRAAASIVVLSDTQARDLEPELYSRYKTLFVELVKATRKVHWRIKLHPLEDESFYQDMVGLSNFTILPKTTTLEQAVTQADVACTLWSTSGLEAMIMRRPLLVLDVHPMVYNFAWWPKFGGGVYAPTLETALAFVNKASSDGQFLAATVVEQDRFLAENFANPGNAAEACLDLMEKVIRPQRPMGNSAEKIGDRARFNEPEVVHGR